MKARSGATAAFALAGLLVFGFNPSDVWAKPPRHGARPLRPKVSNPSGLSSEQKNHIKALDWNRDKELNAGDQKAANKARLDGNKAIEAGKSLDVNGDGITNARDIQKVDHNQDGNIDKAEVEYYNN